MHFKAIAIVAALGALTAGCQQKALPDTASFSGRDAEYMALAPKAEIDFQFHRYLVDDPTGEKPGTIVIDTKSRHLYFVEPNKKAIRYGVAVGSEAYGWTGTAYVRRKAEWPQWMPTESLMNRWPEFGVYRSHGPLAGGPDNPLGARALYLHDSSGRDTLYRIHGTNEPEKIGMAVSSGCIRMRNVDVIDLHARIAMGAKVIVK